MTRLSATIAQLAKLRPAAFPDGDAASTDRLSDISAFGTNPGALRARYYLPDDLGAGAPLVVVLHGCTQTAGGYDRGAGWSQLADELGFAVLLPEQQRANNPNLCFNWFSPADSARGKGEACSIAQMIATMVANHDIDERRIFVTGLSAGGAMASIMLASYPEIFAGGAIIAGLPHGSAASVGDAFARMRGEGYPSDARLTTLVRDASDHDGPWPTISVWQGSADRTVAPSNAERIVAQWTGVHGVADVAPERHIVDGTPCRIWRDAQGRSVVEAYDIMGMGHGTPLSSLGPDGCGTPAPYMLEAGISSTRHIARSWGLAAPEDRGNAPKTDRTSPAPAHPTLHPSVMAKNGAGVAAIIEDALRKAGLMRR